MYLCRGGEASTAFCADGLIVPGGGPPEPTMPISRGGTSSRAAIDSRVGRAATRLPTKAARTAAPVLPFGAASPSSELGVSTSSRWTANPVVFSLPERPGGKSETW